MFETPAGKRVQGRPRRRKGAEEASRTDRGKRVPGVRNHVQIVQAIKIDKLDFHRVCLQSEAVLKTAILS